jgi:LPXTG-site transpeptidase (sortase) family protein
MIRLKKLLAASLILIGFILLAITFIPTTLSSYLLWLSQPADIFNPLAMSAYPQPIYLDPWGRYPTVSPDFSSLSPPESASSEAFMTSEAYFYLSLPGQKITHLPVHTNGGDLKIHPIHYPGTSLPGLAGNVVVFGHSSLPLLYSPKNPYTVFNPLTKVKIGDEITANFTGVDFRYRVSQIRQVKPEITDYLTQHYDTHQLTLVTCVPLGTYLRRLVITSDLVN